MEILEVINWYEEQFGRKLTQAERACIRYQCAIMNSKKPDLKDLKEFGIHLDGLEYGGLEEMVDNATNLLNSVEKGTDENNCNLTTCRYNQAGTCANEDKCKECVKVSKKVLCLEDIKNASRKNNAD